MQKGCLDTEKLANLPGSQTQKQLIKTLKEALSTADACPGEKFHANEDVNKLVKARAWVVDQLILHAGIA